MATEATDKRKCLTPDCTGAVYSRGLCPNCFQAAHRMMRAAKATEAELIEKGLILPSIRDTAFAAAAAERLGGSDA